MLLVASLHYSFCKMFCNFPIFLHNAIFIPFPTLVSANTCDHYSGESEYLSCPIKVDLV